MLKWTKALLSNIAVNDLAKIVICCFPDWTEVTADIIIISVVFAIQDL